MTKQEYESKLQDLQNQLEELKKVEIEEENKVWKPKNGEKYYLIYPNGCIYSEIWAGNKSDKNCYMLDNCFKTKEEAEFEKEKRIIRAKFKRYLKEHNDSIELERSWHNLELNTYNGCVFVNNHNTIITSDYIASSKGILKDAVEFIGGKEVAKKYLFDYTGE